MQQDSRSHSTGQTSSGQKHIGPGPPVGSISSQNSNNPSYVPPPAAVPQRPIPVNVLTSASPPAAAAYPCGASGAKVIQPGLFGSTITPPAAPLVAPARCSNASGAPPDIGAMQPPAGWH